MAKYKIHHVTTYEYSEPVSLCHNQVMLTPVGDSRIKCASHRMHIRPIPTHSTRLRDFFGNQIHRFSIEQSHRKLIVNATTRVNVLAPADFESRLSPPWTAVTDAIAAQHDSQWFDVWLFLRDSPRICRSPLFETYARQCFGTATPVLQGLKNLTALIYADFLYDVNATDVDTATESAFEQQKGVCQDFAHVQISCLRSIGIPARYVSGYLRTTPPTGQPRLVGADQSHAWVSAYCGSEIGWVDVDPTNNIFISTDHIPIARGRDYGDVAPIRGVFIGGGRHALNVSVEVRPE